jgi:hypothetical protein
VAVRSRTEALADWYKAGEQLVQTLGCPQNLFVLIVLLLLFLKELKNRIAEKQNLLIINQLYFLV